MPAVNWPDDDAVTQAAAAARRRPEDWLAATSLARLLHERGERGRAVAALDRFLNEPSTISTRDRILRYDPGVDEQEARGLLHALAFYGYLKLTQNLSDGHFWDAVKNPIACVKYLVGRGQLGLHRGERAWCQLDLEADDCGRSGEQLTTWNLYNNLLVAYSRVPFTSTTRQRQVELTRRNVPSDESPVMHRLLAQLRPRAMAGESPEIETLAWAVSNAERLLACDPEPDDPRLSYTLAQLAVRSGRAVPAFSRELDALAGSLLSRSIYDRQRLTTSELDEFARGVAKLTLRLATNSGEPPNLPDWIDPLLKGDERETWQLIRQLEFSRRSAEWLTTGVPQEWAADLRSRVGDRASGWLQAVRQDLASSWATRANAETGTTRVALLEQARGRLRASDPAPESYERLLAEVGPLDRLTFRAIPAWRHPVTSVLAGLLAAIALWRLVLRRVWLECRRRQALFTSFYRRETRFWVSREH